MKKHLTPISKLPRRAQAELTLGEILTFIVQLLEVVTATIAAKEVTTSSE